MDEDSIRFALEAGVDSIQHARRGLSPGIDDLSVKSRFGFVNTYVVSTGHYFTAEDYRFLDTQASRPTHWIDRVRRIIEQSIADNKDVSDGGPIQAFLKERYTQLRLARDRGVLIGVGTDNMQGMLDSRSKGIQTRISVT
jgi:hypothetical protein